MINVNWDDNAKAAVKAYHWWLGDDNNCGLELDESLGKFMKEVEATTQTKTVSNAVKENQNWIGAAYGRIYINHKDNWLMTGSKEVDSDYWKFVCTGEQFEAYVKEQEGEKWTHVTKDGINCVVLFTEGNESWIKTTWNSELVPTEKLKPIKPKLTKAQAWDKLTGGEFYCMKYGVNELQGKYDITN